MRGSGDLIWGEGEKLVKKLPKLFVLQIVQFSEKIGWGVWAQTFLFEVYSTCVFICKAGGSTMSKMIIPSVQSTNTEIDIYKYTNTQIQNKTFAIFSISWCLKDNKNYIPMCQTHNYNFLAVCIQYKCIF